MRPLTKSETQLIANRPRSIRPMLMVFNEDVQKGAGGKAPAPFYLAGLDVLRGYHRYGSRFRTLLGGLAYRVNSWE